MYNRYVPDGKGYKRIVMEDTPPTAPSPLKAKAPEPLTSTQEHIPVFRQSPVPPDAKEEPEQSELREKLGGDLILLLTLALALVDGDEIDLAITLALIFILGL